MQLILTSTRDFSQIRTELILFGILNVILWLTVEMQWRLSDDYLPLRGAVGETRYLMKISRLIPLRNYDDSQFCDKYFRFQNGIRSQQRFLKSWIQMGTSVYSFVLSCVYLAQINVSFTIILSIFFVLNMFFVRSNADIRNNIRKETAPRRRYASYLQGMFFGIYNRETRLFGLKDQYILDYANNERSITEKELVGSKKINRTTAIISFCGNTIGPLLAVSIALFFVSKKLLLVGSIYTVWSLSRSTLNSAKDTMNVVVNCIAQCKEATETYDTYCEINNMSKVSNAPLEDSNYHSPALYMENVDFSYQSGKKVLNNINLTIKKGEIIALLGENGSGKSTLIKLLMGIYSPDQGHVQVFGHDAYLSEEYIRTHMGIVFQDFCNYPFTLRENVGFGSIREIDNHAKIVDSLMFAQADSVLNKAKTLERMLGKSIDSEGIELSGGEWQRIALARAHFGARDIMIFDEPAAKLDPLAEERQFTSIIRDAHETGKTVILISHRAGFARMADRILFLKNGKIIESGSHAELMSFNGEYSGMFKAQMEMYTAKETEMKHILYILKEAWNVTKKQKSLRVTVYFLWLLHLSYYVVSMLRPLLQSALLDSAVSIFSDMPNYALLIFDLAGILFVEMVLAVYRAKLNPLHTKADSEIRIGIQSKIYDKLCRVSYSVFNSPKVYENINIISEKYASYCSKFLAGSTLSSIIGTCISFAFTTIVLINVNPIIAIVMILGNLFGIFKTWLGAHINYYSIVNNMKDRRYAMHIVQHCLIETQLRKSNFGE